MPQICDDFQQMKKGMSQDHPPRDVYYALLRI